MPKVAINGFGRIGRQTFRIILEKFPELEVVAINDLANNHTLTHLFKYDSTYGVFSGDVKIVDEKTAEFNGKKVQMLEERDPTKLPWGELGVDIVLESTGVFRSRDKAALHLQAGAKKVIISAPGKDAIDATIVLGVNEDTYDTVNHHVISNASCTTNCLAPIAKVLHENFTILRGLMTTIHAYTNDQSILDFPHPDLRRARSAGLSMIPTTTGAAKAVGLVLPELNGKLNGIAIRVPTPTVSLVDLTCDVEKSVTKEDVNNAFKAASESPGFISKKIMRYVDEPLVSVDFKGDPHSSIVDSMSTKVIGENMVKVLAWYDNEWGYSNRYAALCQYIAGRL